MTSRLIRMSGAMLVALALGTWPLLATNPAPDQAQVPAMTGVWKLDVEASENPNGADRPTGCANPMRAGGEGRDRGFGSGGSVGGSDTAGGVALPGASGAAGGALGPAEMARFCNMLNQFYVAPEMMGLQVTQTDFMQLLNPETKFGYMHKTDNKSQDLNTPGGAGEFKVKWDKTKIVREINTEDSLKMIEAFELSADGSQLIVTLEASSRMVRVPDPKIRRVYDRQQ